MTRVAAAGIALDLPPGWEVRLRLQQVSGGRQTRNALLHAATVPLPGDRGDYGSGVWELLGPDDVFVALLEFDEEDLDAVLFAAQGLPRVGPGDFSPAAMQRVVGTCAGGQWFFSVGDRAFCLYAVLGSAARRAAGAARVAGLLSQLQIGRRSP